MQTEKTPKKLLYIITKSNFGGAQRYVLELASAMKSRGYDVAIACGGQGELVTHAKAAGITTYEIVGSQRDIKFQAELKALVSLYQIVKSFAPDIVHLNSSKMGGLGSLVARALRVPRIVFTAHGWPHLEPRRFAWKAMAWIGSFLTCRLVHHVITVSENDAKNAQWFLIQHKHTTIHNALTPFPLYERTQARTALFSQDFIAKHNHQIWVVTHGELNHNKNHTTAIDAVAEFNTTHSVKLLYVIIGSGDTKPALLEQVALRSLSEYVYFLDHIVNVRAYLLAFDIYIMPSLKEGLPYSLLEAGYAGLPVIASNVGGIPEVVRDHESGRLVDPERHMSMVEAFTELVTDTEARVAYASALTSRVTDTFAPRDMIQATEACYTLRK